MRDQPLKVEVVKGRLVISIGLNTLAFAAEEMPDNNPYNDEVNDFIRLYRVIDVDEFAEDVRRELRREEEDGTTVLHELLDKAFLRAIAEGSCAVEEVDDSE